MSYDIHIAKNANEASFKVPVLSITFDDHIRLCREIELSNKPYLRDITDFYEDAVIKGAGKNVMLEEIDKLNLNELSETVLNFMESLKKVIKVAIVKEEDIYFFAD